MHIANVIITMDSSVERNHLFSAKNKTVLNGKIKSFLLETELFKFEPNKDLMVDACVREGFFIIKHHYIFISAPVIEKEC